MKTYLSSPEQALGSHPSGHAARRRALARAERVALILMLLSVVTFLWGCVYPKPYNFIVGVLAILPWVTVLMNVLSHGVFRLNDLENVARNLALAFWMPGLVLLIRATEDFNLLAWTPVLAVSFSIAVALWIAAAASDSRLRRKRARLFAIALACLAYGYGAGIEANVLFDHSSATVYTAKVLRKHISHNRHNLRTYYLDLTFWGQASDNASVSNTFYDSVQKGDRVCVLARPGALHVPWYVVSQCQ